MAQRGQALLVLLFIASFSFAADDPPSAERIIEDAMPSIVAIRAETPAGVSSGTGFIVDPSGVIFTNLHVIEGARRAAIKLHSGEQYTNVMVSTFDEGRDLVILRVPGFELPTLKLGNSDAVRVGATVYAIGNPLGLEESVTKGIVSSVRVGKDGTKLIQTDSAVSPGNSGGPLINEDGYVVGIMTFKLQGGESLNFAVPVNYARALLGIDTLMSLEELSEELRKQDVSLFSEKNGEEEEDLTGTWMSLASSGSERQLTQDGDFLFGSFEADYGRETYDLKRQDDNVYMGVVRSQWTGEYRSNWTWLVSYDPDDSVRHVNCAHDSDIEIKVVSMNRIEGRVHELKIPNKKKKQKEFMKTCGASAARAWTDFVWVRKE